jgi:hypothetical protein
MLQSNKLPIHTIVDFKNRSHETSRKETDVWPSTIYVSELSHSRSVQVCTGLYRSIFTNPRKAGIPKWG